MHISYFSLTQSFYSTCQKASRMGLFCWCFSFPPQVFPNNGFGSLCSMQSQKSPVCLQRSTCTGSLKEGVHGISQGMSAFMKSSISSVTREANGKRHGRRLYLSSGRNSTTACHKATSAPRLPVQLKEITQTNSAWNGDVQERLNKSSEQEKI